MTSTTSSGKRLERPCVWCSRRTTSARGICMSCKTRIVGSPTPGPEHALIGGTWVPGPGGVQRWQPYQPDLERSA